MRSVIFPVLLVILFAGSVFAGGGDSWGYVFSFKGYDKQNNLFYSSVDGVVQYQDAKQKIKERKGSVNIGIYDLNRDTVTYLFKETPNELIVDLYYESSYDPRNRRMIFNGKSDEDEGIENNEDIAQREVSGNLIVITYSMTTDKYSLWLSSKTGQGLKRVREFTSQEEYHLDVANQTMRFVQQVKDQIVVTNIKY